MRTFMLFFLPRLILLMLLLMLLMAFSKPLMQALGDKLDAEHNFIHARGYAAAVRERERDVRAANGL